MNTQQLNKKLRELDELRAELVKQVVPTDGIKALADAQTMIKPGSKEHEALLSAGYGMDKAKAQAIVKERKADSTRWPYEMLTKAEAFMAALAAKPQVVSTRPAWRTRARVLTSAQGG